MKEDKLYPLQMEMRVERLQKLLKLKAPRQIIAGEVILVLKAAVGYCGEHMGNALQAQLLQWIRRGMWLCVSCGSDAGYDHVSALCAKCLAEAEAEDATTPDIDNS